MKLPDSRPSIKKSYHQFGQYDGRDGHGTAYTRSAFISERMTFGEEQYRPNRKDRHCDLLFRCTYYPPVRAHVVSIEQPESNARRHFILYDSHGFTHTGIERISDSIRTYVYCIPGRLCK